MASAVISYLSKSPRARELAASGSSARDQLTSKAELCMSVLTEARRQIAARRFGPLLSRLLARVCDLLDEMDETLIRLDPVRDHEAFVRSAELHRDLEEVQSLVPSKWRSLARGSWLE